MTNETRTVTAQDNLSPRDLLTAEFAHIGAVEGLTESAVAGAAGHVAKFILQGHSFPIADAVPAKGRAKAQAAVAFDRETLTDYFCNGLGRTETRKLITAVQDMCKPTDWAAVHKAILAEQHDAMTANDMEKMAEIAERRRVHELTAGLDGRTKSNKVSETASKGSVRKNATRALQFGAYVLTQTLPDAWDSANGDTVSCVVEGSRIGVTITKDGESATTWHVAGAADKAWAEARKQAETAEPTPAGTADKPSESVTETETKTEASTETAGVGGVQGVMRPKVGLALAAVPLAAQAVADTDQPLTDEEKALAMDAFRALQVLLGTEAVDVLQREAKEAEAAERAEAARKTKTAAKRAPRKAS